MESDPSRTMQVVFGPVLAPGFAGLTSPEGEVDAAASDAELLRGCRGGDTRAWDQLVARYERLVFSVALRNGLGREDAADITQITFVALLDSISQLREDQRLASWLMSVARRQAWRLRQREERQRGTLDTSGRGQDDPVIAWERVATVHDGLRRLGPPCADLLFALYFEPATPSYAEVARRLDRAVGTIGPMRARCLQHLRQLLGEDMFV